MMRYIIFYEIMIRNIFKGRKLNNVTMITEVERKERMPTIEKSP